MIRRKSMLTLFVILTLAIWVYWSSKTELSNTLLTLKKNNEFVKGTLIQPSNTTCKKKTFLIIIVTSYVGHVELRSAHRRAMSLELLQSMNATRVFLLAQIPPNEKYITQAAIEDESKTFGDILQGSFLENYRNLTYKHLMGLRWAATACNDTLFILKVDDDTVFNLEKTYETLSKVDHTDNFLMGYMLNNTKPRRNKENKWYVTFDEYPRNVYPPYLSGWYYITTPAVANMLVEDSIYHPYFWIDDILITGILTESLGMKLQQLPNDYWLEYYELLECCLRDMIKKFIKCDYVVGPNGGRNNLIAEFNDAIRNCDKWRNCTSRNLYRPLKKVCVVFRDREIFGDGQGEVQFLRLK